MNSKDSLFPSPQLKKLSLDKVKQQAVVMGLSQLLQPRNTHAARSTAQNAFLRFIEEEGMSLEEVDQCVRKSLNGRGLATIMDKFTIFLAFTVRTPTEQDRQQIP